MTRARCWLLRNALHRDHIALHHRLTVLHEDAGFATVANVIPELSEQRISELVP